MFQISFFFIFLKNVTSISIIDLFTYDTIFRKNKCTEPLIKINEQ